MHKESAIQIQLVHGGFILSTFHGEEGKTEVFTSQGKLMKALRAAIDEQSLVSKKEAEDASPGPTEGGLFRSRANEIC